MGLFGGEDALRTSGCRRSCGASLGGIGWGLSNSGWRGVASNFLLPDSCPRLSATLSSVPALSVNVQGPPNRLHHFVSRFCFLPSITSRPRLLVNSAGWVEGRRRRPQPEALLLAGRRRPPTQIFPHLLAQQHPIVHLKLKAASSTHPFPFLAPRPFRR